MTDRTLAEKDVIEAFPGYTDKRLIQEMDA